MDRSSKERGDRVLNGWKKMPAAHISAKIRCKVSAQNFYYLLHTAGSRFTPQQASPLALSGLENSREAGGESRRMNTNIR